MFDKNCSKKLHAKIEKVAKSCNIKFWKELKTLNYIF